MTYVLNHLRTDGGPGVHHNQGCVHISVHPQKYTLIPNWLAPVVIANVRPCGKCGGGS